MFESDLFQLRPGLSFRFEMIADGLPVMLIDDLYERPDEIREAALSVDYQPAPFDYPGRVAPAPRDNPSLNRFLGELLALVNSQYLPRVPIAADGKRITNFIRMHTDFALVDVHPDDLRTPQRGPHIDPIPIFGLVYLNREERGGTLFFKRVGEPVSGSQKQGYQTQSGDGYELCGRIEPAFNRLAIYPGFVHHSAEIGSWVESEERFTSPRLTQRLMFF
jgi:hypothetical protein